MKKLLVFLCIMLMTISVPLLAQDTFKEIGSYDPETDPQVNFPQRMIDEATGVTGTEGGEVAPQEPSAQEDPATEGPAADEGAPTVTAAAEGSQGARLVRAAAEIYKRYAVPNSFPYLPETNGGRTGCAQVVNTIFEEAGIPIFGPNVRSGSEDYYNRIRVIATANKLKQMGWVEVTPPPYQAGDVITWNTTGAPDSHIGIVMASGNNVQAISNSSEYGRPRFNPAGPEYAPMTRLLRKVS